MEFSAKQITIRELLDQYDKERLVLNPPYQRNEIWSTNAKKLLIDSINRNYPLPTFFIRLTDSGKWEIVDGQQRTRAIIGFYLKTFPTIEKEFYDPTKFPQFQDYKLLAVFISDLKKSESIEEFYARVNSTGMKLNKPELKKAEYYNTRFLRLIQELAATPKFVDLQLFKESSLNRMNDIDLVSELVAQLIFGITEKKDAVDDLFKKDISPQTYESTRKRFMQTIDVVLDMDSVFPLFNTRYRQRNDFYTLFGFVSNHLSIDPATFKYFYGILALIDEDIKPSNEECEPFKNYALNCVSQSNSKRARGERLWFMEALLLNEANAPTDVQSRVMSYYEMAASDTRRVGGFLCLDLLKLQGIVEEPSLAITHDSL